jgi:hypothetical protein
MWKESEENPNKKYEIDLNHLGYESYILNSCFLQNFHLFSARATTL